MPAADAFEQFIEQNVGRPDVAYTVREAASMLGCHPQTIRRGVRRGEIRAFRLSQSTQSRIRITAEEVRRIRAGA